MRRTSDLPWWLELGVRSRLVRAARLGALALFVSVAVTTTGVHLAVASLLSPAQEDARDFGRHQQVLQVSMGSCNPITQCPVDQQFQDAARAAGGRDTLVLRRTVSARVDAPRVSAPLIETAWNDETYPEQYVRESGRWPSKVDEVMVPATWHLDNGREVSLYAGAHRLHVVGTFRDRLSTEPGDLLVAPGTSGALVSALDRPDHRYRLPEGLVDIRTSSANTARLESSVVSIVADGTHVSRSAAASGIEGETLTRAERPDDWGSYLDRLPWITGWLPLLVVPFLFSCIASFIGVRRYAATVKVAEALGLPTTRVRISAACGWVLAAVLASILGVLAGHALGLSLRPVLQASMSRPLSAPLAPWGLMGFALLAVLAGVVPAAAVGAFASWRENHRSTARALGRLTSLLWRVVQYGGVLVGSAVVVSQFSTASLASDASLMRWIVLVCLVAALIVGIVLATLQDRRGRLPLVLTLALRRLHSTSGATAAVASIVMLMAALPLSAGISVATSEYRASLMRVSAVPEGQVVLGQNFMETGGLPPAVKRSFERYTGLSDPIQTRQALVDTGEVLQGLPYVLESSDEVARFIGHPLSAEQRSVFDSGGLLVPASTANILREGQRLPTKTPAGRNTGDLKVTIVPDVPESYVQGNLGFVSAKKAREANWQLDNGYVTYTNVHGAQLSAALRAAEAMKFDPRAVQTYDVPPRFEMPPALGLAQTVLTVLLGLVAFVVTMRHVGDARPYAATLEAIGLGAGLRDAMVLTMVALSVAAPLVLGYFVAIYANQVGWAEAIHDNYGATVPWDAIWSNLGGTLALVCAAAAAALTYDRLKRR